MNFCIFFAQDFMAVVESRKESYDPIVEKVEAIIECSDSSTANSLQRQLDEMKSSWQLVFAKASEEGEKLTAAVENAKQLDQKMSEMDQWLTKVEGVVAEFQDPSTILDTLEKQREQAKELKEDIDAHREPFKQMKHFSYKITDVCIEEDRIYIEVTILTLEKRWKEIIAVSSARKKSLEENYKLSQKFFNGIDDLMKMLDDAEKSLKEEEPIGADPVHLRLQLKQHKEFQSMLGAHQLAMDFTVKNGKVLMDKSTEDDALVIEGKIADLKARWDIICGLSVERQQKLEEALLFTGMFQDALQSLLDWLSSVEPSLSTETAVMGDLETVQILIDNHKAFQRELNRREANYNSVMDAGRKMLNENKVEEAQDLEVKLNDLKSRFEVVVAMAATKEDRLDNALVLATEFDSAVKTELLLLKEFEDNLREMGPIGDDVDSIRDQLEQHREFHRELMAEEVNVQSAIKKGQVILRFCHPSATQIIQQWLARLKKRWNDVSKWSTQRLTRLEEEMRKMIEDQQLMDELLKWIAEKEAVLLEKEQDPIPEEDYEEVRKLLGEHKEFQEEMAKKQPTYDKLTKSVKRRQSAVPPSQTAEPSKSQQRRSSSKIPKLGPGSSPAGSFTREKSREKLTPSNAFTKEKQRTPSFTRSGSSTRDRGSPALNHLTKKWQHLWLLAMERLRRLQEKLEYIAIRRAAEKFDFEEWKKRFSKWLRDSKSRIQDIFRRMDHDRDGKLTREQFITGVLNTSFPTERWEMEIVANMFERDGLIDYQEFVRALKGAPKPKKPKTESEQIQSEVERQCRACCCHKPFAFQKVGEGKYRFGDSQKLRLIRILRSTVMVRVGGGWETLEEFLGKNDPCRASGRTNLELRPELRQKYVPPGGVTQTTSFLAKRPPLVREGSDVRRPLSRESSSDTLRGERKTGTPKIGLKPNLDVRSSGYGMRREKSGDIRPPSARREKSDVKSPSGIVRQRSGTNLRASAKVDTGLSNIRPPTSSAKVDTGLRRTGKVRRTSSQTSIGEEEGGSKESPRRSVTSPTSKPSSRNGTKLPTKKSASRESLTDAGATARASLPGSSKILSPRTPASKPPASKSTPNYMKGTTSTKAHKKTPKDK